MGGCPYGNVRRDPEFVRRQPLFHERLLSVNPAKAGSICQWHAPLRRLWCVPLFFPHYDEKKAMAGIGTVMPCHRLWRLCYGLSHTLAVGLRGGVGFTTGRQPALPEGWAGVLHAAPRVGRPAPRRLPG